MAHIQWPELCRELNLLRQGYKLIAGIDEAGRGAWAGPVVAAACILPLSDPHLANSLSQVRDSKLLSAHQRDTCYAIITACALSWSAGSASVGEIDRLGILPATRLAMERAVAALSINPDLLMIDAVKLPGLDIPQVVEFKADTHHLSVACASILAKVTRDRLMLELERDWQGYHFSANKGYGTAVHRSAILNRGVTTEHRLTFRPMRELIHGENEEGEPICQNSPTSR